MFIAEEVDEAHRRAGDKGSRTGEDLLDAVDENSSFAELDELCLSMFGGSG